MSKELKSSIVKEYLDKFPNTPSLTLARTIYKDNKDVFTSAEHVRGIIRYWRGAKGATQLKSLKGNNRKYLREFSKDLFNPFQLPESDEREFEHYVIPKQYKNTLILSDIHVPYHSVSAMTCAIQKGIDENVDSIILNGDLIDFHSISNFVKDPRKRHFQEELQLMKDFLDVLQQQLPKAKIFYKQGNHEERLEMYLKVKAPELFGMSQFELDALLDLPMRGIEYINDKRTIKLGKLSIVHGHEMRGGLIPPVNPARGLFLRANASVLAGHFHKTSQHTEPNINKDLISCWSTGCLCELAADYAPNGKVNHGFAIVKTDTNDFRVSNYMILNGKLL